MFYSESLLTKTGPLARVWLASNLDRKLNKQHVLQSDLQESVKDIIGENAAPIALRMSGQLLLGVVKIYNRKTKYLMDDCSEALLKIKMVRNAISLLNALILIDYRRSVLETLIFPAINRTAPTHIL